MKTLLVRLFLFSLFLLLGSPLCQAQETQASSLVFTADLTNFSERSDLSAFKKVLEEVSIIALGENTHGLGEVFKTKVELVKFLHRELGFDLVLFESGFGDAALAWTQIHDFSAKKFTQTFSSNFYYQSKEILELINYSKAQKESPLMIQGIDCQPQQNYLIEKMEQVMLPIDAIFAQRIRPEMYAFNQLYKFEQDQDTTAFYTQRTKFKHFIHQYEELLLAHKEQALSLGIDQVEIDALLQTFEIFERTYADIPFGGMMQWPLAYDIRDSSMFETVKRFKETYPNKKIIIWAQNSHIEHAPKPNHTVNWMGHYLKNTYGDAYYSLGAIVYSGKDLRRKEIVSFEHASTDYFAYHFKQLEQDRFIFDLRNYTPTGFMEKQLRSMESNGNTAVFKAKDRFDGILFLRYSDIPQLIKD